MIVEAKKEIRKELTATIMTPAGGLDVGGSKKQGLTTTGRNEEADMTTRMTIQTQGGNALLAAR
jgi:hypothetical protein